MTNQKARLADLVNQWCPEVAKWINKSIPKQNDEPIGVEE